MVLRDKYERVVRMEKFMLSEEGYEYLTKGIAIGVGIGIFVGAFLGNIIFTFRIKMGRFFILPTPLHFPYLNTGLHVAVLLI